MKQKSEFGLRGHEKAHVNGGEWRANVLGAGGSAPSRTDEADLGF